MEKQVTLQNSDAKLTVSPSLGGAILAFDVELSGQLVSILRNSVNASSVLESSNFPLVPYSNRIKHGCFDWQNQTIKLPLNHLPEKHSIHGHGWQSSWDIIEKSNNTLTIQYCHNADDWPFSYTAEQVFTLHDKTLTIELSLKNTSSTEMPAGLGFHPYFTRTDKTSLKCSPQKMWTVDDECLPIELVDAPDEMNSSMGLKINQQSFDNVFTQSLGDITIHWPEWRAKANISTTGNCKFMVLYNPKDKGFFCVEPVTHCTDAINMTSKGIKNTGVRSLKSQEIMTISMCISLEETLDN
jgi:aldose 1-epimerase